MKLIKVWILFLMLFLGISESFAIDAKMSVKDVIALIQSRVEQDEYKIDMLEDNVSLKFLKTWPLEVLTGLKNSITADQYTITDNDQLGALIDFVDPSGEYSVSGKIIRSVTVNLESEVLYVAIYSVFGGEYGRESGYKLIYILDSKGNLLSSEQID